MSTRWNPTQDLQQVRRTIDTMFDDAWRPFCDNNLALDIDENDGGYIVTASMPGMEPDNIHISIRDNVLTIHGEMGTNRDQSDENNRVVMRERRVGRFSRSVRLHETVEADSVIAEYENGVLTLRIPKGRNRLQQRVSVNVS